MNIPVQKHHPFKHAHVHLGGVWLASVTLQIECTTIRARGGQQTLDKPYALADLIITFVMYYIYENNYCAIITEAFWNIHV